MKTKILFILCCMMMGAAAMAQTDKQTDTIKVYGNCDMCKATIEGTLKKKDGIISKKWDKNTLMLTVTHDPAKITIEQIGKKIADAGYDNQYAVATDAKYNSLHKCCQYDRPKK